LSSREPNLLKEQGTVGMQAGYRSRERTDERTALSCAAWTLATAQLLASSASARERSASCAVEHITTESR
jgi:hypothetical protein